MDLIKDEERILNFIVEKGKTFRKQIAVELNILPRNLNRNIDKLIEKSKIEKGKEGKEVLPAKKRENCKQKHCYLHCQAVFKKQPCKAGCKYVVLHL
jgi:Mn-dependent DtxR family transcriptional regulator